MSNSKWTDRQGQSTTRAYSTWAAMKSRCLKPSDRAYARYGGRGVKVCQRWLVFQNFLDDMGQPPDGMTLDRIDNNGNYDPANCRWATRKEQSRNTSKNVMLTWNGDSMCIREWAERTGIPEATIRNRLDRGWSVIDAISKPSRATSRPLSHLGKTQSVSAWAKELGVSRELISHRINLLGWPVDRALSEPPRLARMP